MLLYANYICFAEPGMLSNEMFQVTFLCNNRGLHISVTQSTERLESYNVTFAGNSYIINSTEIDSSLQLQVLG